MNDSQIETEIQAKGLTAPRVTPQDIEDNIVDELYFTALDGYAGTQPGTGAEYRYGRINSRTLGLLTFCVLVLRNGFTVTGESACASPENFDAELGRKIARQNAVNKIWPLMGYALKQQLHETKAGHRVCRAVWNGKSMWLALGNGVKSNPAVNFWNKHTREFAEKNGGSAPVLPYIIMNTAAGEVLMGWLASQTDMLADYWMLVED